MDVIFLNSTVNKTDPVRYIGPSKISHWLRKHGIDSIVIEFVDILSKDILLKLIRKFISNKTAIIAVSTTFLYNKGKNSKNYESDEIYKFNENYDLPIHVIDALNIIKEEFPKIKFVAGGHNSEVVKAQELFDATVMNYKSHSEELFLEYYNYVIGKGPPPYRNLTYKSEGVSRPWFDEPRTQLYNIMCDDFRWAKENCIVEGEPLPLDVSKGCIFSCKFCRMVEIGKKKYDYVRQPSFIEDELNYNFENFKTQNYYIMCDTFNDTTQKVEDFYNVTQKLNFKIKYSTCARADLIHRFSDTAHQLKESGLFGVHFGIESLNTEASTLIGKAWSGKHAKMYIPELVYDIWKNEVMVTMTFIAGLKGESIDDLKETVRWSIEHDLTSYFAPLTVFNPNVTSNVFSKSEFDKNTINYGYIFPKNNDSRYWENGEWNYDLAKQTAEHLVSQLNVCNKTSIWRIQEMLVAGYSPEELISTPFINIDHTKFNKKMEELLSKYITKISNF